MNARVVIKLGGEVVRSPRARGLAGDVVALARSGSDVVVVHGGGPQATELQRRLGQVPVVVGGRRVTDESALEVMKMVVAGSVNVELCAALLAAGGRPVGLHGASSLVVEARRRPPVRVAGGGPAPIDFGFVGDVVSIGGELLSLLTREGHIPVLACLGADAEGRIYNINADIVAAKVAVGIGADALVFVTDVAGILADPADRSTRRPALSLAEIEEGLRQGTLRGGMLPKVTESLEALRAGVARVHVCGQLGPGDLLRELEAPGSLGTVLRLGE